MNLKSQEMRKLAPELDPLRIGTGWKKEDLGKVQVMIESTYGDSHPGSGHLNILVEEAEALWLHPPEIMPRELLMQPRNLAVRLPLLCLLLPPLLR